MGLCALVLLGLVWFGLVSICAEVGASIVVGSDGREDGDERGAGD